MKYLTLFLLTIGLFACSHEPYIAEQHTAPDVLVVQVDGTMYFRDRAMPPEDVILYNDGFGGERAAVKVYVPYKHDFYRDSIRVYREKPEPVVVTN